ncbi:hypothetical protein WMY93_022994 [Mugilogobius chulae]|uniref:Uncharacterized protein n=1 Tax=Mugilogobius chulae TaxID=88201 RepID=A0AAW0N656_9GOBI
MSFYDDIYPFYRRQRTSFIFSGRLITVIVVFVVLALSLLIILPGIRGKSRLFWMIRILISLFIGVVIVVLNFTCDWAEARMTTNATYKSFSNAVVNADIGLHVGLYGINVTLRGNPVVQLNETINYNEMFSWHDTMDQEYEAALLRGLPDPILYIVEKFTLNSRVASSSNTNTLDASPPQFYGLHFAAGSCPTSFCHACCASRQLHPKSIYGNTLAFFQQQNNT